MKSVIPDPLTAALDPRSIALIGASENPEKIGGRPIKYMLREGYKGRLYPINPRREEIQGLKSWPDLASLPEAPDLAIVAVPGMAALDAVKACAARGVKVAVVMTSGFGETGVAGRRAQDEMAEAARAAGMRLVGPNTQGIVNFGKGMVASFATLIGEVPPADGPVGIVSQSGAMSVVPYYLLRRQGIGVRHSHATGNEADLTVADFAVAVSLDPEVKLLLLYLEAVADPDMLALAARIARERELPIIALKAGVSAGGQAAALSHTGALATEDRVIDAFLRQHGIFRVPDMKGLVSAAELYLQGWRPRGRRLVVISNSGASCVMAADAAEKLNLPLARFADATRAKLRTVLPEFAGSSNPIDLTAALISNNRMFGELLPVVGADEAGDAFFIGLPMSGANYDVPAFARDSAAFVRHVGKPLVVGALHEATLQQFREAGVVTFAHDIDALAALAQFLDHRELMLRKPAQPIEFPAVALPQGSSRFLSEAQSLRLLAQHGFPVVRHRLCRSIEQARAAFAELGGPVAVKACSVDIPHKSEHALVRLNCRSEEEVGAAYAELCAKLAQLESADAGIIVARMAHALREFVLGARMDARFGPVVMLGDGGKYVEALPDFALLLYPFTAQDARERLAGLRIAPLYAGVRGEPPLELQVLCDMAVRVGALLAAADGAIASVDLNPVMVGGSAEQTLIADALIERAIAP